MSTNEVFPAATRETLQLRARLLNRLREFFYERGFLEVETPLLSADTVVEQHIDPIPVLLASDPRRPNEGQPMWLQSSPEFHMKRMLASGDYDALFQIGKAFRAGERGALHNPEFTIVEWYRVGDDFHAGMGLLAELCTALLDTSSPELLSYTQAFQRYAGIDPLLEQGLATPDEQLNLLLAQQVEPRLGCDRPTILYHYPASQAALARTATDAAGREVAERFELYVDGIELANGYHELLDATELRHRNETNNARRSEEGRPVLPSESKLLAAMEHGLPECTGVALGFDRLVMVAAGESKIDEVLTFPIERA